mgnify:CR=1 FL=1
MSESNTAPEVTVSEVEAPRKLTEKVSRLEIDAQIEAARNIVTSGFAFESIREGLSDLGDRQAEIVVQTEPKVKSAVEKAKGEKDAAQERIDRVRNERKEAKRKGKSFKKAQVHVEPMKASAPDMEPGEVETEYTAHMGKVDRILTEQIAKTLTEATAAEGDLSAAKAEKKDISYLKIIAGELAKIPGHTEAKTLLAKLQEALRTVGKHEKTAVILVAGQNAVAQQVVARAREGIVPSELVDRFGGDKGLISAVDQVRVREEGKLTRRVEKRLRKAGLPEVATLYETVIGQILEEEAGPEVVRGAISGEIDKRLEEILAEGGEELTALREKVGEMINPLLVGLPEHALNSGKLGNWEEEHAGSLSDPLRRTVFNAVPRLNIADQLGCEIAMGEEGGVEASVGEPRESFTKGIYGRTMRTELAVQMVVERLTDEQLTERLNRGDISALHEVKALMMIVEDSVKEKAALEKMAKARVSSVRVRLNMSRAAETGVKVAEAAGVAVLGYVAFRGVSAGAEALGVSVDGIVAQSGEKLTSLWSQLGEAGTAVVEAAGTTNTGVAGTAVSNAGEAMRGIRLWETIQKVGPTIATALKAEGAIIKVVAPIVSAVSAGVTLKEKARAAVARVIRRRRKG